MPAYSALIPLLLAAAAPAGKQSFPYAIASVPFVEALVLSDGTEVRLVGVSPMTARDPIRPEDAAKALDSQLKGRRVRVERYENGGKDPKGRLLAYVYLETGTLVSAYILERGLAYGFYAYPTRRIADLRLAEQKAVAAKAGVWAPLGNAQGVTGGTALPATFIPASAHIMPGVTLYVGGPTRGDAVGVVMDVGKRLDWGTGERYDAVLIAFLSGRVEWRSRASITQHNLPVPQRTWWVREDDPALK